MTPSKQTALLACRKRRPWACVLKRSFKTRERCTDPVRVDKCNHVPAEKRRKIICSHTYILNAKHTRFCYNQTMKKIFQHEALEWSNLFLLIPVTLAIIYGLYLYAIILSVLFFVSFDFHYFKEAKDIYYLDVLFSYTIMASNFVLLFMSHWHLPYSLIAVLFALIALFFYFRRSKHDYYFNHSLWHVFSSGVCLFCLLTFLSFL